MQYLVEEVLKVWPGKVVIIRGRPRHPQTQGLVEKGNDTAKKMIDKLRLDFKGTENPKAKWSYWVPMVQCKQVSELMQMHCLFFFS